MYKPLSVAASFASFFVAATASADVLLASIAFEGTGQTTAQQAWTPYISYGDPGTPNPVGYLNDTTLTILDVLNGTAYDLAGDFAGFELSAVDGVNQPLHLGFTVPGGTGADQTALEQALLASAFTPVPGIGSPDFAGYDLTRVRVMATAFQSGVGGQFTATTEFMVYGNRVPEPASAMAMMLAVPRRRRRG
jgi:hypothetical protein